MGCEPSTIEMMTEASEQEFKLSYSQFVAKTRGNIFEHYKFTKFLSRSPSSIIRKVTHKIKKTERICKIISLPKKQCILAMKEVEILRNLDHPNIVQIIEYYLEDSFLYIILENIPGENLTTQMIANRGFKMRHILSMIKQLMLAVEYCHKHRFAHRAI